MKIVAGVLVLTGIFAVSANAKISDETQQCKECHNDIMKGIVDQ